MRETLRFFRCVEDWAIGTSGDRPVRVSVLACAAGFGAVVDIEVSVAAAEMDMWLCLEARVDLDIVRQLHRALAEPGGVDISAVALDAYRGGPATIALNERGDRMTVTVTVEGDDQWPSSSRGACVARAELAAALAAAIEHHDAEARA